MSEVQYVPISQLKLPQDYIRYGVSRETIDKIKSDILSGLGIQIPLLVREVKGGYEVVDGVHRLIAAQEAKLDKVPCRVVYANDTEALILAFKVNAERKNVGAKEKLKVAWLLLNKYAKSLDEVKAELNLTRVDVHRLRMLSEKLDAETQDKWLKGELSLRDALRLAGSPVEGKRKAMVSRETMKLSGCTLTIYVHSGNIDEVVNVLCTVVDGVPCVERLHNTVSIKTDTCKIVVCKPHGSEGGGEEG